MKFTKENITNLVELLEDLESVTYREAVFCPVQDKKQYMYGKADAYREVLKALKERGGLESLRGKYEETYEEQDSWYDFFDGCR